MSRRGRPGLAALTWVETQHCRGPAPAHPPPTPPGTPSCTGRATGRSRCVPVPVPLTAKHWGDGGPTEADPGSAFVYLARGRGLCRTLPVWDGGPWIPAEVGSVVRSEGRPEVPATEHHFRQRTPWHRRNGPHHWAVRTGYHTRYHVDRTPPCEGMLRSGWIRIGPQPRTPQLCLWCFRCWIMLPLGDAVCPHSTRLSRVPV